MRLPVVSSLVACLALAGGLAMARPPVSGAARKVIVARPVEIPVSTEAGPERRATCPASFVRSGGARFKDADGAAWTGRAARDGDLDRLGNDYAIAAIYRMAEPAFGTSIAPTCIAKVDGAAYLLAKNVDVPGPLGDEQLKRFGDGFVIDAWLGSADIGGAWQLAIDAAGRPLRSSAGGGGLFRARGDAKGAAFTDDVPELQKMRDPLHATSFGYRLVGPRDVKDQLQRFATWYPAHRAEVEAAIDDAPLGVAAQRALKTKLAARAHWLLGQTKK